MFSRLIDRYQKSLHLKIMVPALAIMITVVAALSVFAGVLVHDSVRNTELESAHRQAALMATDDAVVVGILHGDSSDLERILARALHSTKSAVAVAVYGNNDGVYELIHRKFEGDDLQGLFPLRLSGIGDNLSGRLGEDGDGNDVLVFTEFVWLQPMQPQNAFFGTNTRAYTSPVGVVQVAYTFEFAAERGSRYIGVILLISLGITLFGALATNRITTNFLKPISVLNAGLKRISEGRLEHRIHADCEDEIGAMTVRFNEMAERLDASQEQIRQHARLLEEKVVERTRELQEAYDELQTLDQAKDGFLSSISHEMRTPLTSILASVEILEEFADNDPAARHEFLQIIDREANRMLSLVVDVLDLAKFEAQTMQLELVEHDLLELLREVVESLQMMARDSSVTLTLQPNTKPVKYPCDSDRIRRVVRSLIHNGIKFSPSGTTVEVGINLSSRWVYISVRDHGPGIPEEERDHVFGLFSQAHGGKDRATSGVGLGLPISLKIARVHGGDLRYEDPGDGGSRFVLSLPLVTETRTMRRRRQLSGQA